MNRFAATRAEALEAWERFLSRAPEYAALRNRVVPGHPHVSRLSPAIRSRVVSEEELLGSLLGRFPMVRVEKLVQEILWRQYWKGWLELRPQVWGAYRAGVRHWLNHGKAAVLARAREVAEGRSGVAVMDGFARELLETGYLHNHARMWWASFWIHVERLPWELGADWFHRHLLDADPASNTLGWRWVAGIQTPGKAYPVRRSNLERYCAPELLADDTGLDRLNDDRVETVTLVDEVDRGIRPLEPLPEVPTEVGSRVAIWVHGEDASVENSALGGLRPVLVMADADPGRFPEDGMGSGRIGHMRLAIVDAMARASEHYGCPSLEVIRSGDGSLVEGLVERCRQERISDLVAMRPAVGPLREAVGQLTERLASVGVAMRWCRRGEDTRLWPLARSGYFGFWESVRRQRFAQS